MKMVRIITALTFIFGLYPLDAKTFTQEFSKSTENEIAGYNTELKIAFSAIKMDIDSYMATYRFNNKIITIRISYAEGGQAAALRGIDSNTGAIALITPDETELFETFLERVLEVVSVQSRLEMIFVRTLNLLASWPATKPLIMEIDSSRIEDIPTPQSLGIEDICGKVNQLHDGEYPIWGIWTPFSPREVGPYPWELADCLGRCGKGCVGDGPPNNNLYIFSQDCFNHDVCVGDRGSLDLDCIIAFDQTFDDFLYGASCQKDNLDIIINGRDDPVDMEVNDVLDIAVTVKNIPPYLTIKGYYLLYAETPLGTYWYNPTNGWQRSDSPIPYIYYDLVNVQDFPIYTDLLPADFPMGLSTFYFSFVTSSDPAVGQYEDALEVSVTQGSISDFQPANR